MTEDENAPARAATRQPGQVKTTQSSHPNPSQALEPVVLYLRVIRPGMREIFHDRPHRYWGDQYLTVIRAGSVEWTKTRRRRQGDVTDQNIRPPGRGWALHSETDHDKSTLWVRTVEEPETCWTVCRSRADYATGLRVDRRPPGEGWVKVESVREATEILTKWVRGNDR